MTVVSKNVFFCCILLYSVDDARICCLFFLCIVCFSVVCYLELLKLVKKPRFEFFFVKMQLFLQKNP